MEITKVRLLGDILRGEVEINVGKPNKHKVWTQALLSSAGTIRGSVPLRFFEDRNALISLGKSGIMEVDDYTFRYKPKKKKTVDMGVVCLACGHKQVNDRATCEKCKTILFLSVKPKGDIDDELRDTEGDGELEL
jgi:hypothetical protein